MTNPITAPHPDLVRLAAAIIALDVETRGSLIAAVTCMHHDKPLRAMWVEVANLAKISATPTGSAAPLATATALAGRTRSLLAAIARLDPDVRNRIAERLLTVETAHATADVHRALGAVVTRVGNRMDAA